MCVVKGRYRVATVPDETYDPEDLKGDIFNPKFNPEIAPAELKRQEREFEATIGSDGVWGWVIEEQCPYCHAWTHVDSCWGYVGREFAKTSGLEQLTYLVSEGKEPK